MSWQTIFFDWRRPPLHEAAEWLCTQFQTENEIDLAQTLVVTPGGLAGRRLLELLLEHAESKGFILFPPRIVTAGHLPELLFEPEGPSANSLAQQLAWTETLRRLGPDRVAPVVPSFPASDDWRSQLELGKLFQQLHADLSADLLDFSDILKAGAKLPQFNETERWKTLSALQHEYHDVLHEGGLVDPYAARRAAIEGSRIQFTGKIVLVGMIDLDQTQRVMLAQVSQQVTALVFAPESLRSRFDATGCVAVEAWQDAKLEIPMDRVSLVAGPSEQASEAARRLTTLNGQYAAEEITLGVPDDKLAPFLSQSFAEQQVVTRYAIGKATSQAEPVRLLSGLADFLRKRDFHTLARLARLPILTPWLAGQGFPENILTPLDRYAQSAVPGKLRGKWLAKNSHGAGITSKLVHAMDELTRPLAGPARPLGEWGPIIINLLGSVLGGTNYSRDQEPGRSTVLACEQLRDLGFSFAELPISLQTNLTGADALAFLLSEAEVGMIPAPEVEDAISLLGWLELPWDDAPVMVVCSLSEGIVPSNKNSDLFLPNELRQVLSMDDNRRRYARDAYLLQLLIACRAETFLIVPRRNTADEPVMPSRLLFACAEDELPQRTVALLGDPPARPLERRWPKATTPYHFAPRRLEFETVEPLAMRVTEFGDYLECPYRYYLRHRLGLGDVDDSATELDGGGFGSLLHDVLEAFGGSDMRDATNSAAIAEFLHDHLATAAVSRFGERPAPAVVIQIEQARQRLAAFATWQAQWRVAGYEIAYTEQKFEGSDGHVRLVSEEVNLIGRIDRIDIHRQKNLAIIFDYKTSDHGDSPDKVHRTSGEWRGLQLPLYRHLAGKLKFDCRELQLGYILLPKDLANVGQSLATWNSDELHAADVVAAKVISSIRQCIFWPPTNPPPANFPELAAICVDSQSRWRGQLAADAREGEGGTP
jgi:hypothetical protein